MNAIKATWTKGQIVPAEPVDWPEGKKLIVEPDDSNDEVEAGGHSGFFSQKEF